MFKTATNNEQAAVKTLLIPLIITRLPTGRPHTKTIFLSIEVLPDFANSHAQRGVGAGIAVNFGDRMDGGGVVFAT